MTLYICECNKEKKEVGKQTIVYRDGAWVTLEAVCGCNKFMKGVPNEGMPNLIRTEASLSRNKRHNKLWDSAKEKLCGERGINESFD
tara:strand:- start:1346 stop:1606 length:261 start_codon:yes stop_codon:yes gene_type:complete